MATTIKGTVNNTVYGKGDICLKINPFDCYRMFTLYEDWKSDDRIPLDLSGGQNLYLVFKSKTKEIRVPEYDTVNTGVTVDKVNGQVLFKITQKNAVDILAMDDRTFYITRYYTVYDMSGNSVISSDEEALYSGQWTDDSNGVEGDYSSQLKTLNALLEDRESLIKSLQESNADLINQNVEYANEIETLRALNSEQESELADLRARLSEYESGTEYDGTIVGDGTHYTILSNTAYTEEQMENVVKTLESTMID